MEPGLVKTLVTIAAYFLSQSNGGVSTVTPPSGGSGRRAVGHRVLQRVLSRRKPSLQRAPRQRQAP